MIMKSFIRNISDTARWVTIFRAEESERPDAVFHDPFARKLAGELGEKIANKVTFSKKNSWSFVARTYLFDEYITRQVEQGYDMIINLAAGLDARPYRMNLPLSLKWVDVDLPGILDYKNSILKNEKPVCVLRSIQLDLADGNARLEFFRQLNDECKKALVVTEGLLIYLSYEQAGSLSTDLSSQKHFQRWAFDLQSPGLLAMAQKEMGDALKDSNAAFQFAPKEGEAFFLQYGWRWLESKSKLKTAAALKRLSDEMMEFAAYPEPEGPKGDFPWSGVCLFENVNAIQNQ
jgi:methyltransferase (TIGR00027 family)